MNQDFLKIEEKRKTAYQGYSKKNLTGLILAIPGVVLIVLGIILNEYTIFFIFPGAVLIVIGSVFLAAAGKLKREFTAEFKSIVVTKLLKDMYKDPVYYPGGKIDLQTIMATGLVKRPDRYSGEDYIQANYKGVNFEVSDVKLEEKYTTTDSKGHTQTHWRTYFLGRWYRFSYKKTFEHSLRIVEKGLFGYVGSPRKYEKIDFESIEFNKKFVSQATDQQFAFYLITPVMFEKIQKLEQMHRGHISFLFDKNELHIAINDNQNYLEPKLAVPLTDESISTYAIGTDIMASIINEFKLDGDKFNNGS